MERPLSHFMFPTGYGFQATSAPSINRLAGIALVWGLWRCDGAVTERG